MNRAFWTTGVLGMLMFVAGAIFDHVVFGAKPLDMGGPATRGAFVPPPPEIKYNPPPGADDWRCLVAVINDDPAKYEFRVTRDGEDMVMTGRGRSPKDPYPTSALGKGPTETNVRGHNTVTATTEGQCLVKAAKPGIYHYQVWLDEGSTGNVAPQ